MKVTMELTFGVKVAPTPDGATKLPDEMVIVMLLLCATRLREPVQSSVSSDIEVFQTAAPVPEPLSKNTLSPVVGAIWLPAPPDESAQLVVGEEFQLVLVPPPTQYLLGMGASQSY